jgi:hypothetical protein
MPNASNVLVATTGAVYVAPLGTSPPANSTASWSTAWKELGYLSEDGIEEDPSIDVQEIKVWQSGLIVRRVLTGSGLQWKFTVVETNLATVGLFWPGSVVTQLTGPPVETRTDIKTPVIVPQAIGFDVLDGSTIERTVVPRAELAGRDSRNLVNGAARPFPITMSGVPDTAGIVAIRYNNPQMT